MLLLQSMGKRILNMLLCTVAVLSLAFPGSAAMVELEPVTADRRVCAVRYSPREESTVIGNLEDGTPLEVLEEAGDYVRISSGRMTGYLAKEQVKIDDNGCYYVNLTGEDQTLPCRAPEEIDGIRQQIRTLALEQLGTPYVYGGTGPWGFDCSGFVQYIFRQVEYTLNRTASSQLCSGLIVEDHALLPGDIVFFRGTSSESGIASHVGIYLGEGEFVHASSSRGVIVSDLTKGYYAEHYLCARRVVLSRVAEYTSVPGATRSADETDWPVPALFFRP